MAFLSMDKVEFSTQGYYIGNDSLDIVNWKEFFYDIE